MTTKQSQIQQFNAEIDAAETVIRNLESENDRTKEQLREMAAALERINIRSTPLLETDTLNEAARDLRHVHDISSAALAKYRGQS